MLILVTENRMGTALVSPQSQDWWWVWKVRLESERGLLFCFISHTWTCTVVSPRTRAVITAISQQLPLLLHRFFLD